MTKSRKKRKPRPELSLDEAIEALEKILAGDARRRIVSTVGSKRGFHPALTALRDQMVVNQFDAGGEPIRLARLVHQFGVAMRLNEATIPVDVANYMVGAPPDAAEPQAVLAVLLDYYFLYVLALLSLRVWDDGRADEHLAALDELLGHLQGDGGSGQQFVAKLTIGWNPEWNTLQHDPDMVPAARQA